jgi:hypothetical protein
MAQATIRLDALDAEIDAVEKGNRESVRPSEQKNLRRSNL